MKNFTINKNLYIHCEYKKTRNGFKHEATLIQDNYKQIAFTKVCYLNRTWESFEYKSVIQKLLSSLSEEILTKRKAKNFLLRNSGNNKKQVKKDFGLIIGIAKMGAIMTNDLKETNNFQTRILSAGLPGLIIPEDWNKLPEEEKQKKLTNVLNELDK